MVEAIDRRPFLNRAGELITHILPRPSIALSKETFKLIVNQSPRGKERWIIGACIILAGISGLGIKAALEREQPALAIPFLLAAGVAIAGAAGAIGLLREHRARQNESRRLMNTTIKYTSSTETPPPSETITLD